MNERFVELEKQATEIVKCGLNGTSTAESFNRKKFAELIVRECTNVIEGGSFLHDQAPTAIFAKECSGAIKRHFGVE
jgi:hypothetical protein